MMRGSGIIRTMGWFTRRVGRIPFVAGRNGLRRSVQLVWMVAVLPWVVPLVRRGFLLCTGVGRVLWGRLPFLARWQVRHTWWLRKGDLLEAGKTGYRLAVEDLGLEPEQMARIRASGEMSDEVPLADIDQDGFFLSRIGPIPNVPTVSANEYMPRRRFLLTLVARHGELGVRKDYRGNVVSFVRELRALHLLTQAGCNVPAILDVDFDRLVITLSYISGRVLREELAKRGTVPRDRDLVHDASYQALPERAKRQTHILKDPGALAGVLEAGFVDALFEQVRQIHETGVVLSDVKYGNIVIEKHSGRPYFLDFDSAANYSRLPPWLQRFRWDTDIERLNDIFGTQRLTYVRIRRTLKQARAVRCGASVPAGSLGPVYAPAYIGAGLRLGAVWHEGKGEGRWHYLLKRYLPPLAGKRVLDLGTNNAFNSIQMLRAGAREVVGVELEEEFMVQGRFLKDAFEWADNKSYNLIYLQGNMADVPSMELGKFDMAVSLCALYHIDTEAIAPLVRHVSEITDIFVLQANVLNPKPQASVECAVQALCQNGFPCTRVIAPWRYTRPLIIGTKES